MIARLLKIRFLQLYRTFAGIGLFRAVFLVALTGFAGFAVFQSTVAPGSARWTTAGFVGLIALVHVNRNDKAFLKIHFAHSRMLMFAEYLAASVPLAVCLLIHGQWAALAGLSVLAVIVHLDLRAAQFNLNTSLQARIPADAIEWKAGVRKQFFLLVPIWVLAAGTSFFIGSIPVAIVILGISTLSFCENGEPHPVLLAGERGTVRFLRLKLKRQLQLFSWPVLPLVGLFVVLHPANWYVAVVLYGIFCSLQVYAVLTKYAFYEPNGKPAAAQVFTAIGAVGGLIPFLLPVVWALCFWFYSKAVVNLNFYLDDYN